VKPVLTFDGVQVFHGDCVEVMRSLPDASVDSVVTDPPYGLEFMGKDWDAPWKGDVRQRGDSTFDAADESAPFGRVRHGGTRAYGTDSAVVGQAFQLWCTEWATEALRVLKPGGHLLAFGGTRTWHRLAVAIEDAGFEVRDSIAWMYGSGFPKSLDVSKAIDKRDDRT
jgi:DNA modification methylase